MPRAVPTTRCAAVLATVGLLALAAPWWLLAAGTLMLAVAFAVDAWRVREPPQLERTVHPVLSLGVATRLQVRTHPTDARRVLVRQPATAALAVRPEELASALDGLEATVVGRRRGMHELPAVASASLGPLGLARVHHPAGPPLALTVYPDIVRARALILRLRRSLAAHAGQATSVALGVGTDFESIREYTPDDDIRQVNWRASARAGRPMSNQYRLERDRDVVLLLDTGRLMAAPVEAKTMLDVALDAATVLALATDELGDRCGAIAYAGRVRVHLAPSHRASRRVIEGLFALEPLSTESDPERAFVRVGRARRALVVVFTDLVDEAAARSLLAAVPMLTRRHAVLVASCADRTLTELRSRPPTSERDLAAAVVAEDVRRAREAAAAALRRRGAILLEASADQLGARCLDAYLRVKSRVGL